MGRYSGPALVTDHAGEQHGVRANLTSYPAGGLTAWRGTLSGDAPWFDMLTARGEYAVRIGDRDGMFAVQSLGGVEEITSAVVVGARGPVPFD